MSFVFVDIALLSLLVYNFLTIYVSPPFLLLYFLVVLKIMGLLVTIAVEGTTPNLVA